MPFTSFYSFKQALSATANRSFYSKSITAAAAGLDQSQWFVTGSIPAGANPGAGSGTIFTGSTSGAIPLPVIANPTVNPGKSLYFCGLRHNNVVVSTNLAKHLRLEDYLWGRGSLDLKVAATTTITGSYAPRGVNQGEYLELWLECGTAPTGTTGVNPVVTVSYTNQAGTAGRTARFYDTTGAERLPIAFNIVGRRIRATLQAGDYGIRSVESMTVVTASTVWTGGSWNLIISQRISSCMIAPTFNGRMQTRDFLYTGIAKVMEQDTSTTPCLNFVLSASSATGMTLLTTELLFALG